MQGKINPKFLRTEAGEEKMEGWKGIHTGSDLMAHWGS